MLWDICFYTLHHAIIVLQYISSLSSLSNHSVPWLGEGLSLLLPHLPILRYHTYNGLVVLRPTSGKVSSVWSNWLSQVNATAKYIYCHTTNKDMEKGEPCYFGSNFFVKVAISGDCGMEGNIPRTRGQTHEQCGQTHRTVKVTIELETQSR